MISNSRAMATLNIVESDSELPESVDVVVIGGGIVGVSTALFLAKSGVRVCLCEKGEIAGEQSSRNWGWVRQMGRDSNEVPLSIESLRVWRSFKEDFGVDAGYRETGITYLSRNEREMRESEGWAAVGREFQLPQQVLNAKQIAEFLPGVASGFSYALHTSSDGRAEPTMAGPAFAQVAKSFGATVLTHCAVRGVETSAGKVSAVVTEKGVMKCSQVVIAGGAWSRLFLGNLGIDFPQLKILVTAARVTGISGVPDMPVGGGDFAFRKRLDGGFTISLRGTNIAPVVPDSLRLLPEFLPTYVSAWRELKLRVGQQFLTEFNMPRNWAMDQATPFESIRVLDPMPHKPFNNKALKTATHAFPAFVDAAITNQWAGLIDATPDAVPVIDAVRGWPGLFLASGFSGHGFGIGPGAGKLMSQIVTGDTPCVDPTPFQLNRYRSSSRSFRNRSVNAAGEVSR